MQGRRAAERAGRLRGGGGGCRLERGWCAPLALASRCLGSALASPAAGVRGRGQESASSSRKGSEGKCPRLLL